MRNYSYLSLAIVLGLFTSALATHSVIDQEAATDIHNPIYANLGFPADHEIVEIKPIADDTILEEGTEREVKSSDVGKPELVPEEKPVTRTLDNVNLSESDLDPTSVKIPDEVNSDSGPVTDNALPVAARWKPRCPANCSVHRKYCPYGCRIKYCYIRIPIRVKVKRRVVIKIPVKVRRVILVRYKICRRSRHPPYKPHCIIKYKKKIIYVTVFKYKTIIKVYYITKYKYKRGIRCKRH